MVLVIGTDFYSDFYDECREEKNQEWKLSLFLEFELSMRYLTSSFKGQLNKWI